MNLIVELGDSKPDANAYGVTDETATLAAARAFALLRGVDLPADDDLLITQLVLATDYLETFADRFVGIIATDTQALAWPRTSVQTALGATFPSNALPASLLAAMYQLCIEQTTGVVLLQSVDPKRDGGFVVREKVDVIETQYSERVRVTTAPLMPAVDAYLSGLLFSKQPSGFGSVRV